MRVVIFCHSVLSDWNHGNAHFLRGVVSELLSRGHVVTVYEPRGAWSLKNLLADYGMSPVRRLLSVCPWLESVRYDLDGLDLGEALDGADLVIVHEWNDHELVRKIGEYRRSAGGFKLLFHDTHHRSITKPEEMERYDLSNYDGVLAFGEVIREIYISRGWAARAWVWHEAADVRLFRPFPGLILAGDLVWIGNWGDGERTSELREFLHGPARALGLKTRVHGVRYPASAIETLRESGMEYGGWLPNYAVPHIFARYKFTVHVPRRPYAGALPGIPTIRVFEALACGIPLVSAPWEDSEGLFTPGKDFIVARSGAEMKERLKELLNDGGLRQELSAHGLDTILKRHTCGHRVDELMAVYAGL
ncbi:MAG: glycosyltransferase [Deltaproteobacteria bacterium]|nr:glycosyltransferase [Deltaproteobacteria bacterium]